MKGRLLRHPDQLAELWNQEFSAFNYDERLFFVLNLYFLDLSKRIIAQIHWLSIEVYLGDPPGLKSECHFLSFKSFSYLLLLFLA